MPTPRVANKIDNVNQQHMNQGLTIVLVPATLFILAVANFGWVVGAAENEQVFEQARGWAAIIGPVLTSVSLLIAAFVAYKNYLTPFEPVTIARPYIWRMGPVTHESRSLEIVMWITVSNKGAVSGTLDDLAVQIQLPKGKWTLEPLAFAKSDEYLQLMFGRQSEYPPVEGPFTLMLLTGKSQITKAVIFVPATGGLTDFNPSFAEAGQHRLTLSARFNSKEFISVKTETLIFEDELLEQWKAGNMIGGQVTQREKPTRELLGE